MVGKEPSALPYTASLTTQRAEEILFPLDRSLRDGRPLCFFLKRRVLPLSQEVFDRESGVLQNPHREATTEIAASMHGNCHRNRPACVPKRYMASGLSIFSKPLRLQESNDVLSRNLRHA